MTDQELRDIVASLAEQQKQTSQSLEETNRVIREVGRQIGGLGDKFGSFTEGLALPSMTKILTRDFQMDVVAPRVRARRNGHAMEVDVLAYSNDPEGDVYVVEVKSHLREDALEQMRRILAEFRDYFPVHRDKKIYGILAAVDAPQELAKKVLREGLYLARIHDGQFEIQVPEGFQPRAF